MGRPRRDSHGPIPPKVTIAINGELEDSLRHYMATMQIGTAEVAIHDLIRVALASTPGDGLLVAARWQAYYEIKTFFLKRAMAFLSELRKDLESEVSQLASKRSGR